MKSKVFWLDLVLKWIYTDADYVPVEWIHNFLTKTIPSKKDYKKIILSI